MATAIETNERIHKIAVIETGSNWRRWASSEGRYSHGGNTVWTDQNCIVEKDEKNWKKWKKVLTTENLSGKIVFADAVIKQRAEAEKQPFYSIWAVDGPW